MRANEVKTMDDAAKFYSSEFNKIAAADTTNENKAEMLNQLNRTMTNIYSSLK